MVNERKMPVLRQCKCLSNCISTGETLGEVRLSEYLAFTESALKWPPALSLKIPFSTQLLFPQSRMKDRHQQA